MKKRLFIILFLLLIPTISYAASNPYPRAQTFNGVVSTPCTRVAWQEAYDRLGIALPGWGNAVDWYRNAANAGYQVGSDAKPNSIAVYSGFQGYGHVAFVVSVSDETMHVVENKGSGEGKTEGNRSKGIGSGEASDLYLIGFIYITEPKTAGSSSNSSSSGSTTTTKKSNNSNLKSLTIEGIDFEFTKDNYFYTLNVPYETSGITISGKTDSSKAKVDGLKDYELNVGENIITIKVTAEDKSESSYILNITRDEKVEEETPKEENKTEVKEKQNVKKFKWSNYYLIPIIGLVILISVVIIILVKKKKKKKSKSKK